MRNNIPHGRLRVVWGKPDTEELLARLERHAAEAIELTKEIHPASLSKLLQEADEALDADNPPCPVVDLFTREQVR